MITRKAEGNGDVVFRLRDDDGRLLATLTLHAPVQGEGEAAGCLLQWADRVWGGPAPKVLPFPRPTTTDPGPRRA